MESDIGAVRIAYFSGTGGTRRVAETFHQEFAERGLDTGLLALEGPVIRGGWGGADKSGFLVLVFAVHAFDAPAPVYAWVRGTDLSGVRAAVVSVSGGGETFPNTGCRARIIAELEKRGCAVCYDRMLIMPCNWVIPSGPHVSMHLLLAMPGKVRSIVEDVLAGRSRRGKGKLGFVRRWITNREKTNGRRFGRLYKVSDACTGCGWCARCCPTQNIEMKEGRPDFRDDCLICFRCVYGCPNHAISSKNFMVLKRGFDLSALEKSMRGVPLQPVADCCKGWAWKGVREYLMNEDK